METRPTVSVILPTYNRSDLLDDSIRSVLDQTYTDFELIVVDDGSTDDSDEVIASYDSDRVRYYKHEKNQGASAARNTGIRKARGDFIAFQDSDDEWHPEKLEKQMEVFQNSSPDVGVVYTGIWRIVDNERRYLPYPGVKQKEGDIQQSIQHFNFIPVQVAVVRNECFEKVGMFDEETPPIDDWELWLRISKHYDFKLVDEPLVVAPVREDSISKDRTALVQARERIVNKHYSSFSRDALANHLFFVGHGSMKLNQVQKGRKYLLRAAITYPHPRYVVTGTLSFSGPYLYNRVYNLYKSRDDLPGKRIRETILG